MDAVAVVRAWFDAFNRDDIETLVSLYAPAAVADTDAAVLEGADAIAAWLRSHFAETTPAFADGVRRRVRTMGPLDAGVSCEWVACERSVGDESGGATDRPSWQAAGYDYFNVAGGRIVAQREVSRPVPPDDLTGADARPSSRRYPERPVVGVGAVIVQDGRVVLIRRRFEPLAGQWSLPGGTLELGETLEAAVAREMLEETGLVVEVGPVVEVFDRILLDPDARVRYHFVLIDYLCRPVGGALVAASDVADAVWADPGDLARYRLTVKATTVIERAMRMPGTWSV